MLSFFKSHFALIPSLIILSIIIFLRLDVLMSSFEINVWNENISPFSQAFRYVVGQDLLANRAFNMLVSAIIIFIQSGLIISIFSKLRHKVLKTFLPAWIFVLLMHLHPSLVFLSPQMLSFTFVLLSIRQLLRFNESKKQRRTTFEIGILLGIASMFWAPSALFFLTIIYYLQKNSFFSFKVFLSLLFSFLMPVLYVFAYYILKDSFKETLNIFNVLAINNFQIVFFPLNQFLSSTVVFVLSFASIYFTMGFLRKETMEIKHLFSLVFFFVFNVFLIYFFQKENTISMIIFLYFPVSVLLNILFNRIKRNIVAEFVHLVLLLTIIINFMNFT